MPQYDYHCRDCGKNFTLYLTLAQKGGKKSACPGCGSRKLTQKFSAFFAKTSRKS